MTLVSRIAWRYAVLIILLIAIVAVAARSTIAYLEEYIPDPEAQTVAGIAIWTLTMGFMFLAGALGLWVIQSSVDIEFRRRIGQFVDAMDYLSDGLLALDKNGFVTGSNPAAKSLALNGISDREPRKLFEVFPCLTAEDAEQLMDFSGPRETERDCAYPHGLRTLRFRSQPSAGMMLILVSDVTSRRALEMQRKQMAQLQLLGRIAGGVAHDFNNILCAIGGHASLIQRAEHDSEARKRSLAIIAEETQRGAQLSRQLLELGRSGTAEQPTGQLEANVAEAVELLRVGLSSGWTVKTLMNGPFPTVPLNAGQIVQLILNLGLLAADAQSGSGTLTVTVTRPGQGHLADVGTRFSAVLVISAESQVGGAESVPLVFDEGSPSIVDDSGAILSVLRSLVEETGGRMDRLTSPQGLCVYRVCLPHMDLAASRRSEGAAVAAKELAEQLSRWKVLLSPGGAPSDLLMRRLGDMGATAEVKDNVIAVVAAVQAASYDGLLLHKRIFGMETEGLLKALLKLAPDAGIVVLCDDAQPVPADLAQDVLFESETEPPDMILWALAKARTLATKRH
ncbi:MAG: hypothetical protein HY343_02200 [Lentisphaerae bacterium]|nr:hypothetical protein [Lentisphaerota bacterium]